VSFGTAISIASPRTQPGLMMPRHSELLHAVAALHSVREAGADRLRAGQWLEHFQQSTEAWEVVAQRPCRHI